MSDDLKQVLGKHRKPDPSLVSKLPRITCGECRAQRSKVCGTHSKSKCSDCGNYITSAHIHLDYVGHADVTSVLIEIDPAWSWEPASWTPEGAPSTVEHGGTIEMWGRLTLLGVSRIGVGSCDKGKPDVGKELVGDFLRNAAMRFGIFVDLWSKSEASSVEVETDAPRQASRAQRPPSSVSAKTARMMALFGENDLKTREDRLSFSSSVVGRELESSKDLTEDEIDQIIVKLEAMKAHL